MFVVLKPIEKEGGETPPSFVFNRYFVCTLLLSNYLATPEK
jgi:hypothetical protein